MLALFWWPCGESQRFYLNWDFSVCIPWCYQKVPNKLILTKSNLSKDLKCQRSIPHYHCICKENEFSIWDESFGHSWPAALNSICFIKIERTWNMLWGVGFSMFYWCEISVSKNIWQKWSQFRLHRNKIMFIGINDCS